MADPYAQFADAPSSSAADPYAQFADHNPNPAPTPKAKQPYSYADFLAAVPETSTHLGTGMLAAPAAGLAGIGQGAVNLYKDATGAPITRTASDAVASTQNALTYQPRTQGGQDLSSALSYPFQKIAQGANAAGAYTADITGSPYVGANVNTAIQAIPMLMGGRFAADAPPVARPVAAVNPAVADATSIGLRLTPEQAGGGFVPRAIQSLSGSAKLERSLSKTNADTVNTVAKQEIGIPADQPINEQTLAAARAPHNAVYQKVASLGAVPTDAAYQSAIANVANRTGSGSFSFNVSPAVTNLKNGFGALPEFDAGDAVAQVRQLRRDGNMNLGAYNPEQNALGTAQKGIAEALEAQLDRHVQALSQSGAAPANLINQLRDSRVQLAKIATVEKALDDAGNVSAKSLSKQDKGQMSGNLGTIADAYGNFNRSLQDVSAIRDGGPFSVLDGMLGAGVGMAHPGILASVLSRPLARATLASGPYQKSLAAGGFNWPEIPNSSVVPLIGSEQQTRDPFDSIGLPGR